MLTSYNNSSILPYDNSSIPLYDDSSFSPYGMSAVNCTTYPNLQANSDISGIGVVISFIATGYLTLACCVAKSILDRLRKTASNERARSSARWSFALESAIISFSDQQLVTGISVIIGGLLQLEWGLSIYHFQTVGYLAWFSTMTHILTLTVLRGKIQGRLSPLMKIVRVVLMGCLVVLLIYVMAPFGYLSSAYGFHGFNLPNGIVEGPIPLQFPAWCLYNPSLDWRDENGLPIIHTGPYGYNITYTILTLGIIIYGYTSRVLLMFPGVFSHSMLRIPPGQPWIFIESRLTKLRSYYDIIETPITTRTARFLKRSAGLAHFLCHSIYVLLVSGKLVFESAFWELTWLSVAVLWGTLRLVSILVLRVSDNDGDYRNDSLAVSQQNTWGFGQVVVLVLLGLPLLSFLEAYINCIEEQLPLTQSNSTDTRIASNAPVLRDTELQVDLSVKLWYRCLQALWYLLLLLIISWILTTVGVTGGSLLSPIDGSTATNGSYDQGDQSGSLRPLFSQFAMAVLVNIGILWTFVLLMQSEWPLLSHKVTTIFLTFLWFSMSVVFFVFGLLLLDFNTNNSYSFFR